MQQTPLGGLRGSNHLWRTGHTTGAVGRMAYISSAAVADSVMPCAQCTHPLEGGLAHCRASQVKEQTETAAPTGASSHAA